MSVPLVAFALLSGIVVGMGLSAYAENAIRRDTAAARIIVIEKQAYRLVPLEPRP